jgi:arylsulfatase A-like enzyme
MDFIPWTSFGRIVARYHGNARVRMPNLDQMAKEGMRLMDYYAEASCTAGRANFITGELPIRTGMTTVDQAGLDRLSRRRTDDSQRAARAGLRDRPVRQEPSGRPQLDVADRARLR